jgi:hypothetical protein
MYIYLCQLEYYFKKKHQKKLELQTNVCIFEIIRPLSPFTKGA